MNHTAKEYLLTLHFLADFRSVLAQAEREGPSRDQHQLLYRAEVAGYKSLIEDLMAEAEQFEREHIVVLYDADDDLFCATCDLHPTIQGIESSETGARRELNLALAEHLNFHPEESVL